jgi:hypothetical protein
VLIHAYNHNYVGDIGKIAVLGQLGEKHETLSEK